MKIPLFDKSKTKTILVSFLAFSVSLIVRLVTWQDLHVGGMKVQSGVYGLYRLTAKYLLEDGLFSYFNPQARIADIELLGHPPGYAILISLIFRFTGESDAALQFASIFFDALSVVLIFLIVKELLSFKTALLTALIAAFASALAVNSISLLPDSLSVFPVLLAVYFFVRSYKGARISLIILCGVCLGISCWLRSNSLLMPIFFIFAILLLFERERKLKYSAALIFAFVLTIAPITIRNAVVYRAFIPISLGAGQTLLEGIGDYDPEQKLGIPNTDFGICQMEAEKFNRPEYAKSLFGEDGIWRDRMRVALGWQVIKENPFWFAKVVVHRAFLMLKMEKVKPVSSEIPVIHSHTENISSSPVWEISSQQLAETGTLISPNAALSQSADGKYLILQTDATKYDPQFSSPPFSVKRDREYLAEISMKITSGRVSIKVVGSESGREYKSVTPEYDDWNKADFQSEHILKIPFVPARDENIKFIISNEAPSSPTSLLEIRQINIYDLGEASFTWTRPLRWIIRYSQKLITTNVILPLAFAGLIILIRRKERTALIILAIVPMYYFCIQSLLHTEYRYVLAIHYFVFSLAAVTVVAFGNFIVNKVRSWKNSKVRKTVQES